MNPGLATIDNWESDTAALIRPGPLRSLTSEADDGTTLRRDDWSLDLAIAGSRYSLGVVPVRELALEAPGNLVFVVSEDGRLVETGCVESLDATALEAWIWGGAWAHLGDRSSTTVDIDGSRHEYATEKMRDWFLEISRNSGDYIYADGMDSALSAGIDQAIRNLGEVAVDALRMVAMSGDVDEDTVGEILRQVGYIDDAPTRSRRLAVLHEFLSSEDVRIRDASLVGLSAMVDPASVGAVRAAYRRERSPELRRDLKWLLEELNGL